MQYVKCIIPYIWDSRKNLSDPTTDHFHRNIRSRVENVLYCPCTVNIWMLTLLQKYLYDQSHYPNISDRKCLGLISQVVRSFAMVPKVRGSSPPSGRDIFCPSQTWMLLPAHSQHFKWKFYFKNIKSLNIYSKILQSIYNGVFLENMLQSPNEYPCISNIYYFVLRVIHIHCCIINTYILKLSSTMGMFPFW